MEDDDLIFTEDEDFLIVEDLDLSDEAELRRVVNEVEALARPSRELTHGRGLRVSVLTVEQWKSVMRELLPPGMKKGSAHLYLYTLRNPKDHQHLLVSPSAVQGINEGDPSMYRSVVYAALRCLPTQLPELLRKGIDDIVAQSVGERIDVPVFTRHHPRETKFCQDLLAVLSDQFGYSELDWALEMRRQPKKCLMALRKTRFGSFWKERVEAGSTAELVEVLSQRSLHFEEPLVAATEEALVAYLEEVS